MGALEEDPLRLDHELRRRSAASASGRTPIGRVESAASPWQSEVTTFDVPLLR